jgi:predicted permease
MWLDLRYSFRTLRQSPVFATIAVLCLGLGIGANTAIFSLLDAVLLRMLPVNQPEQLAIVQSLDPKGRGGSSFSYPQFDYLRQHADSVAGVFGYARININLSAGELTDAPAGLAVSDNYFSVLGVEPAFGRGFAPSDADAAILSHRFWRSRFNGDPNTIGGVVRLNGLPFTVVGVAPPRFFGAEVGSWPDVFVPLTAYDRLIAGPPRLPRPNNFWLSVMVRLRSDVATPQAIALTDAVYHQGVSEQSAGLQPGLVTFLQQRRINFIPGARGLHTVGEQFGTPLLILMAVVCLVLLIACANVANLLLARAAQRRREIAVRLAVGASRGRLVRQLLIESLTISAAGGAVGLLFAVWSAQALTGFLTNRFLDVRLDARIMVFTLLTTLLTVLLFGLGPAIRAARTDLTPAFKGESSATSRARGMSLGRFLVSGQVAISVLLLFGAGLFIQTLGNLRGLDAGFRGNDVLLATLNPGLSRYTPERTTAFYAELLARVSGLPGVRSASLADAPLLGGSYRDGLSIEGSSQQGEVSLRIVAPHFFETMGIPIRLGRDFSADDRASSPKVAIINETIARTYFPGVNPLGRHIGLGGPADMEIVGVVADAKYRGLRESVPNTGYLPMTQGRWSGAERTLHVRTFAATAGTAAAVRAQVQALDPNLPVKIALFSELVDANLAQERLIATLSGFFGGLALLLTATGLYGVIAFNVQRRTREIGIRMSLGARRPTVVWMVLRDSLLLVFLGIAVGIPASFWLSRLVQRQLFDVTPNDPGTMFAATVFLMAVTTAAGYVPARRASRVDPVVALRCD